VTERWEKFIKRLHSGALILGDGAWSTLMQGMGLQVGDCPEEWNVVRPTQVQDIAQLKMPDLNAKDMTGAMRIVEGSARSMGLEVVEG